MNTKNNYKVDYRTLSDGKHNIEFHIDSQLFKLAEESEIHDGDCKVQIALTKGLSILRLEIEIDGKVTVDCDRCLDEVSVPVHFEGVLLVKITNDVKDSEFVIDDKIEDTLLMNPTVEMLDLEGYLYDSILLSLPLQRVHSDNELGESGCNPDMLSRFTIADNDFYFGDADDDDQEEEDKDDDL